MLAFCLKILIRVLNSEIDMGKNSCKMFDMKCMFCALEYPEYVFRAASKKQISFTFGVMILQME